MINLTFRPIVITVLLLTISSCNNSPARIQSFKVEVKGALKNIMHKGDLSAKVNLSEFTNIQNFYGLGAVENLKGEIQIFDSEPYNSYIEQGKIKFDESYRLSASLLVYSIVEKWVAIEIPNSVISEENLENYIEKVAKEYNIDTDQPFPFLIEGRADEITWHVINWKEGDTEHSHEKHISSGLNGTIEYSEVKFLGFYSNSHHTIFTHHTSNMHIHMKLNNGEIAGHVDAFKLGKNMILKLPLNDKTSPFK